MKKTWLAVVALVLAVAIVAIFFRPASTPANAPPLAGEMAKFTLAEKPAPATAFTALDGKPATLGDFAGRVVLVNLWATWCAPCVREMPTLDRLQADLGDSGLTVIALSSDRGGAATVRPFVEEHGLRNIGIFLDPKSEMTRAFGVRGLPTTILLDRTGREVGRLEGTAEWDSPDAKALLRHYLDEKKPA